MEEARLVKLAERVGELLAEKGQTLALAESCTGGLVGHLVTEVAGSSRYFVLGVVSYSNEAKVQVLGVERELLVEHGAVSRPVAEAMARGVRELAGSDWAVAVTGIAGPGGGRPDKPVGTVHFAVAGPSGTAWRHRVFGGSRGEVKRRAAGEALAFLLEHIEGEG